MRKRAYGAMRLYDGLAGLCQRPIESCVLRFQLSELHEGILTRGMLGGELPGRQLLLQAVHLLQMETAMHSPRSTF